MIHQSQCNSNQLDPVYDIKNVSISYNKGQTKALRGVDLKIEKNDFVVIRGPSGSGKSTLLNMMATLEQPDLGDICYNGKSLMSQINQLQYRSHEIGLIFQDFKLFPTFTALENVQIPMLEMKWTQAYRLDRAKSLLDSVGLNNRMTHSPSELSGGEKQRLAIARALANKPAVVLADEPTGNLDSQNTHQIMELLRQLHSQTEATIILVTHDPEVASYARREIQMKDGVIHSISHSNQSRS
jgi:putative ABC transport system ATP-binding protein